LTLFAGKAVGAVAAALAVTELLRLLHGGPIHKLIDLELKSPDYRSAVKAQHDFSTLNPGCFLQGRDRRGAGWLTAPNIAFTRKSAIAYLGVVRRDTRQPPNEGGSTTSFACSCYASESAQRLVLHGLSCSP
jgi:hypothetical protein